MKKRIKKVAVLLATLLIALISAFIFPILNFVDEDEIVENTEESIEETENPIDIAIIHMNEEMSEIENIEDKEEWYKAYKTITYRYSDVLDPPETIYDYFTYEEIYLMCRVIETECYDQDFMSKANIASVLLNRIHSGEFGNTVEEVITRPNQFVYGRKKITESTILALEYSFEINDTTNGALYFHSGNKKEKFNGANFIFQDSSGHCFYK